jgi:hypothetical protein
MGFPEDAHMKPPRGCYDFLGAYFFDVRDFVRLNELIYFLATAKEV